MKPIKVPPMMAPRLPTRGNERTIVNVEVPVALQKGWEHILRAV